MPAFELSTKELFIFTIILLLGGMLLLRFFPQLLTWILYGALIFIAVKILMKVVVD